MASFWKPKACGQTVLPDRSFLIGQKLVENGKIQKFKCDILSNFQTMWPYWSSLQNYTRVCMESSVSTRFNTTTLLKLGKNFMMCITRWKISLLVVDGVSTSSQFQFITNQWTLIDGMFWNGRKWVNFWEQNSISNPVNLLT